MSVQTVLGPAKRKDLGRTLTHEHLSLDFTHFYRKPPQQLAKRIQQEVCLSNLSYLRQYPYSSWNNLRFDDESTNVAVATDVKNYKSFGGGTIVENTTNGLGRNLNLMKSVSEESGVHVVAGTGFYIEDTQADDVRHFAQEEIYNHMVKELLVGCDEDNTIKAGFMGEIASVWPLRDFERRVIKAAGEVQEHVGCGVSFHPHRVPAAPAEILRLYLEAGGSADRAIMSHLDRTLLEDEQLLEFAKLGAYCQFDLFGVEVSYYQLSIDTDMPSDAQRLQKVKLLIDEGHENRILMSHDIHTKHRLTTYGGHGYAHILNNVLPRMKSKGISQETIDMITIENPADWLIGSNN